MGGDGGGGDGGGSGGGEGSDLGSVGWTADGELSDGQGHSTSGASYGDNSGDLGGNLDDMDSYDTTYDDDGSKQSTFSINPISALATILTLPLSLPARIGVGIAASALDSLLGTPSLATATVSRNGISLGSDLSSPVNSTPSPAAEISSPEAADPNAPAAGYSPGVAFSSSITTEDLAAPTASPSSSAVSSAVSSSPSAPTNDTNLDAGNDTPSAPVPMSRNISLISSNNVFPPDDTGGEDPDPIEETRRRLRTGTSLLSNGYGGYI